MMVSIMHPEALNIMEDTQGQIHFGGDQEWYLEDWHRMAGCGPTCAANVTAYLAMTRPELRALYAGEDMRKNLFSAHMEDLFRYVTPGTMGLNRVEMYTRGMAEFVGSRGLCLLEHTFEVTSNMAGNRPPVSKLAEFVHAGLESDCPIAFLNLTKGRVKNIQSWHWITLTAAEIDEQKLFAWASDESKEIRFDLRMWYLSTRMGGGLIYYTEA